MRMLITDLDNTLYDWVTFFSKAFKAMVGELSNLISVDENQLLDEFKAIHQYYGNTEQPFAILELPSVKRHFGELSRFELMHKLNGPLHSFNSTRKKHFNLYESVSNTLSILHSNGFIIVGHTEAVAENGYYRLQRLGIKDFFRHLYALEGMYLGHPDPVRGAELSPPKGFIRTVPKSERKPNPELLFDICNREGVSRDCTWYVGDSLVRDIAMAKNAKVKAIWARYGTNIDKSLWDILVRVTHWTDEDVKREAELRKQYDRIEPDYTIDSFEEILSIVGITTRPVLF